MPSKIFLQFSHTNCPGQPIVAIDLANGHSIIILFDFLDHIINVVIQIFIENQLIIMEPQEAALEPQFGQYLTSAKGLVSWTHLRKLAPDHVLQ